MGMWDPFIASTSEHVDSASSKIVFDGFHIMKHMNGAVDLVRRMESKDSKKMGTLKKAKYI